MSGENHHIVPRSIRPDLAKDKDNIVRLTYREHYVAHLLLYKIYENDIVNNRKMGFAIVRMCKNRNGLKVTSHEFEMAKLICSKNQRENPRDYSKEERMQMSKRSLKNWQNADYRNRVIASVKNAYKNTSLLKQISEKQKALWSDEAERQKRIDGLRKVAPKISESKKGSIPWNKGKTGIYSQEALDRISHAQKGRKFSSERCAQISEINKIYQNLPEVIEKKRSSMKKVCESEEYRNHLRETQIKRYENPDERKKTSERFTGLIFWTNLELNKRIRSRECPGPGWQKGKLQLKGGESLCIS